jgi:aminopeptidase N
MFRVLTTTFTFLLIAASVAAQEDVIPTTTYHDVPGSEPREHPVDMTKMQLAVDFDPQKGEVRGRVTHTFTVLRKLVDSIEFDAVKITIKQALLNGKPARTTVTDSTVIVHCEPPLHWDTTGSVAFTYTATPRKGIYFIGWNDPTGRMRKQIWTQGQGVDNRHWIPMYDEMNDKMITSMEVRFDSGYVVVSNGRRERVDTNTDGSLTWMYTMPKPHSSYLVMLAIGKYDVTTRRSASGVPIELYSYPDRPDQIEPTYRWSVESMDWLEEEIGIPYPWGVYRQVPVADFIYGAMENTTATIFGDFYMANEREHLDRSYVNTNVHELTHQWFGDLVTARSKKHHWLQESFATYYPYLFTRVTEGEDHYQWQRRSMQMQSLDAGKKDRKPIVHPDAGSSRYYPKGACVLHMLSEVYGRDQFRRAVAHYVKNHAFGNVETHDLYQSFQDTLGVTPDWFFKQWLYRGGEPHYAVSWMAGSTNSLKGSIPTTVISVLQIQSVDHLVEYFRMPVTMAVHYDDGTVDSVTAIVDGPHTQVVVPNPDDKDIAFVLFDPGSHILKSVSFEKSWQELLAQLEDAPHMIDRYDALVQIGKDKNHTDDIPDILDGVLSNEAFHAMRSKAVEIAFELTRRKVDAAWKIVERGLSDSDVEVRKGAVRLLNPIPEQLRAAVETLLGDRSYEVVNEALWRLSRSFPQRARDYVQQTSELASPFKRIEVTRLEILARQGDTSALSKLADYAGVSFDFWTRGNAFKAFKRLSVLTPAAATALVDALWNPNGRLSENAKETLESLCQSEQNKAIVRAVAEAMKPDANQRRMIDRLVH